MSPASGIESGYAWRLAVVSMICIAASGGSAFLPIVAMSQMAQEFGGSARYPRSPTRSATSARVPAAS